MTAVLDLAIAGLGLRLVLGPELEAVVRARYAGFACPLEAPDVLLELTSERRAPGPRRGLPELREAGGLLVLSEPQGFWAELDPKSGRAGARCPIGTPDHPLEQVPVSVRGAISAISAVMLPRRRGGLLLHAAGVAPGGRGAACVGVSGAGKSTICGMFPEGEQLNDELVGVVRETSGRFTLHSTPFSGTLDLPRCRRAVPLAAGLVLHKAAAVRVAPAERRDVFRLLMRCATLLHGDDLSETLSFSMCAALVDVVPWRDFHFPLDAGATAAAVRSLATEPA